jgi:hypothetical protein
MEHGVAIEGVNLASGHILPIWELMASMDSGMV